MKGHSGIWGNERCDMIAISFASRAKIDLFHGKFIDYDPRILSNKVSAGYQSAISVSQKSKSSSKSGKAYSYVAFVNGKIQIFKDWESCKSVVHGRSSKYKKVLSKADEDSLVKEWSK